MTSTFIATNVRRKAVWGPRRALTSLVLAGALGFAAAPVAAGSNASKGHAVDPRQPAKHVKNYKLDDELQKAADRGPRDKTTRVIVELKPGARVPSDLNKFGRLGARLGIINGQVVDVPNSLLKKLADHSDVFRLHFDRPA